MPFAAQKGFTVEQGVRFLATFIVDTLSQIDSAVLSYAQTVFTAVGTPIRNLIIASGLVSLPIIAVNAMMQFRPMQMGSFVTWLVRFVIVLAVASSWTQFGAIYSILTDVPANYGGALLSAANFGTPTAGGLNAAMDDMVTGIFDFADEANSNTSVFSISITAIVLTVLGSFMATVAIIVSAVGKIGLALAVSIAPLAIASMMFRGTSQLFESWSRFTLGFALIPLVLAGIMGAIIGVGSDLISTASGATELSQAAGFIIVVLAAIFLMYQVPTLTSGLAGSIVAAAGAGFVAASVGSALGLARGTAGRAANAGSRIAASSREARFASDNGGSGRDIIRARLAGARQSSFQRESRRESLRIDSIGRTSKTANRSTARQNSTGSTPSTTAPSGAELAARAGAASAASNAGGGSSQPNNAQRAALANGSRGGF